MATRRPLRRWDVFCRVVDHYGDAGVSLRLARTLAAAPGREVWLWVDRPEVALALIEPRPAGDAVAGWHDRSGLRIGAWGAMSGTTGTKRARPGSNAAGADALPDVAVETFGGGLPDAVLTAMRAARANGEAVPVWINLEYLSAEDWVEGCHGLPSPQPGGLTRWFVFPGFTSRTAGLTGPQTALPELPPRLAELVAAARAASVPTQAAPGNTQPGTRPPTAKAATGTDPAPLLGSVFCYRESPLPALLDAMQAGARDVRLLVPAGMPGDLGGRALGPDPGATWQSGRLTLVRIPFVDQDAYDTLLAACDFNLVRGEDSFSRAQWAARPLLWAAYRQAEDAHRSKVDAWLARCGMPPAWAALTRWFNRGTAPDDAASAKVAAPDQRSEKQAEVSASTGADALWSAAIAEFEATCTWSAVWRDHLLSLPRLEDALAEFASRHASTVQ